MAKYFNVSGPCAQGVHYMLPAEGRLEGVDLFIERGLYFVIHAPRQVGKTTAFQALAERLTAEGHYVALHTSCEQAQAAGDDLEVGVSAVIRTIRHDAERLPEQLRPPEPQNDVESLEPFAELPDAMGGGVSFASRPLSR